MANFQPPPTYALPIDVDEKTGKAQFSPIWLKWFLDLVGILNGIGAGGGIPVSSLDPSGGLANQVIKINGALTGFEFASIVSLGDGIAVTFSSTEIRLAVEALLESLADLSVVQGDLIYGTGTDAVARLAKDANATRYLSNTGGSNAPAWALVNLANGITGVLGLTNGGTAASSATQTYTPGLTNVTNITASTSYAAQYMRVGNTVTVSGKVDVDPTAVGAVVLGIALPIASNIGAAENCAGTAFCPTIAGQGAAILGDAANDRAQMQWTAVDVTNQPMYYTYTYQVI